MPTTTGAIAEAVVVATIAQVQNNVAPTGGTVPTEAIAPPVSNPIKATKATKRWIKVMALPVHNIVSLSMAEDKKTPAKDLIKVLAM